MKRALSLFALVLVPAIASAGPLIDFAGAGGNLGVYQTTVGGVTAYSVGGHLYQRDEPNDHGLGVCGPGEDCRFGDYNELSGDDEWIILRKPEGFKWTGLWLSSLDGSEAGYYILGGYPVGGTRFAAGQGAFATSVEALIPLDSLQPLLWIHPDFRLCDNDFLVWGVDLEPVESVPEPASLALLGTGLLFGGSRWRRAR